MTGRQGEARVWCKVGITFWRGAAPSASTCIPFHTSRRHSIRQCVQQTPSFWHSARKVVATCYESAKTRMQGRSRGKMKRGKEGPTLRLPRWPARADGVPLHLQGTHESRRTLNSTAWGETGAKKNTRIHSGNLIRFCPSSWYFLRFLCG